MRNDDAGFGGSRSAEHRSHQAQADSGTDQLGSDERGDGAGAIPANVSLKARPIVTAGLANDVEEVNQ